MLKKINGPCFIDLINSGIKNLDKHRTVLNDLNVFPVPDGDTGTNMVMTLRYGFDAVKSKNRELCEIAREFSSAAVFGARGNSGVIISQFFKGLSNALDTLEEIDPAVFANALQNGCKYAYASVANPVEGTMLTVVKDASVAVTNALPLDSINEAVDIFLSEAKKSLQNTPELLPILKKASVVDSGGSGIVYFFEGVKKFLDGDSIDAPEKETTDKKEYIDLTRFNKNTSFEYGYCFEGLLQLRIDPEKFNHAAFKHELSGFADSIVSSQESDKLKLHAHTKTPENIFALCRKFGEFLTVKIENMTVQNIMKEQNEKKPPKFLYDPDRQPSGFAVVAVATNPYIQKKFFDMGADIVILSEIAPSSQDFMDAFKLTSSKRILVFPNSSNSILSSMQAGSLYKNGMAVILNSRSVPECFACLSVMDFDASIDEAVASANSTLSNIYQFSIYHAVRDVKYGSKKIAKGDFFALSGNKILNTGTILDGITVSTVKAALDTHECELLTLYYGKRISEDYVDHISSELSALDLDCEIAAVSTEETLYDLTVTLE